MSTLPKPPGQRIERGANKGKSGWHTLPAAEDFKRPPTLPRRKPDWLKSTREWWATLWASPMATTFLAADVPALLRLAEMVDTRSRGELGPTETSAMVVLEDRFGLSPKARRALQWEIAQHERADDGKPAEVPQLRRVK